MSRDIRGIRRVLPEGEAGSDVFRAGPRIAALAAGQNGNITRAQLRRIGLNADQIDRLIVRRYLIVRHRGVYAVGHLALPPFADEAAAILALAPSAYLSCRSSAYLQGIALDRRGSRAPTQVDVTVVGRRPRGREGVNLRTLAGLAPGDLTYRHGLPVTSPGRVMIELAGVLKGWRLAWVLDTAAAEGRVTVREIGEAIERAPARTAGVATLRSLLDQPSPCGRIRSGLEQGLLELCARAGFPAPEVNAMVGPFEVDFLWRVERLAVEVDSYAFHSTRERLRRDRRKDAHLRGAGLTVLRFADDQFAGGAEPVVVDLARALDPQRVRSQT